MNYECSLKQVIPLGAHDLFLGEVKRVVANQSVLKDSALDPSKFKALLLFSNSYFGVGKKLDVYGYSRSKK